MGWVGGIKSSQPYLLNLIITKCKSLWPWKGQGKAPHQAVKMYKIISHMLLDFSAACCNFFFKWFWLPSVLHSWNTSVNVTNLSITVLFSAVQLRVDTKAATSCLCTSSRFAEPFSLSLWFIFAAPPHNSSYRSLHLLWNGKTEPILRILGIFFFLIVGG